MSRLTPLKPIQVIRILRALGFEKIRREGSHAYYRHIKVCDDQIDSLFFKDIQCFPTITRFYKTNRIG